MSVSESPIVVVVWRDAVGGLVKVEVKHSHTESRIIDQFVEQEEVSVVREKFWEELQVIPTCLR